MPAGVDGGGWKDDGMKGSKRGKERVESIEKARERESRVRERRSSERTRESQSESVRRIAGEQGRGLCFEMRESESRGEEQLLDFLFLGVFLSN